MFVSSKRSILYLMQLMLVVVLLSSCGLLGRGNASEPEPDTSVRALVPTFTPTPEGAVDPAAEQAAAPEGEAVAEPTVNTPEPQEAATNMPEPPTPEPPTPTPSPKLVVNIDIANVRTGPGTSYGLAGSVNAGDVFDIIGKNDAGDWWQFCCVNGQEGWIYNDIVSTENTESVQVAANIPAAPVVEQQPVVSEPEPTAPPAPQPAADPCAGIGGDGCKFHVSGGPLHGGNGGTEIKMQLFFKHSGVDGGQPQGSYFVVLEKDGVKLPVSDSIRSIANDSSDGMLGRYNYEYKVGIGDIPGNTVAGNYTMWVLDGNGERDSQNLNFSIPEGQGELWVEWDQG